MAIDVAAGQERCVM